VKYVKRRSAFWRGLPFRPWNPRLEESYLVDASAMIARPLFFIHDPDHYIEDSQDLNYSAVIVPPRW
jgi:hypothetical protein